jgi:hypothetical protein
MKSLGNFFLTIFDFEIKIFSLAAMLPIVSVEEHLFPAFVLARIESGTLALDSVTL